MRHKARPYYMQTLTVEGAGQFPLDMLRYDTCVPAYESEIHLIAMTIRDGEHYLAPRKIRLQRFSSHADHGPTKARWESFLWKVVEWEAVT